MQASLRAVEKKPLPHMLAVTNMLLHGIEDPSFLHHDNTLARPYVSWGQNDRVDIVLTNPPFGGKEEDGIEFNFPEAFPDARDGGPVPRSHHPTSQSLVDARPWFFPTGPCSARASRPGSRNT